MEILLKSVGAGIVTGIILLLAKYVGPKVAGAIAGIPIIFAVSYVLMIMRDKSGATDYLIGGIYGALAAVFFSLVLIFLNQKITEHYYLNFAIAYALCFCFAYGMAVFTTK